MLQEQAADAASEYVRHFTTQELVVGPGTEARMRKTLLKKVDRAMLEQLAQLHKSKDSCTVKLQEHSQSVTEAELLKVWACCNVILPMKR